MVKGRDPNAFFRCKARRDILEYGRKGMLAEDEIGRLHATMTQELVVSLKKEVDDDVKRFTNQILEYLEAPRSPGGTWLQNDAVPQAKTLETTVYSGEPVYRTNCAWRSALIRSLRDNRTNSGSRNLELASTRSNGTKLNRVVVFRGFVPDTEGQPKDRLYYVADAKIEKAEQAMRDVDAEMTWRFKMTKETYIITGRMLTIRSHRGDKVYGDLEEVKLTVEDEEQDLLYYRRIAWNACNEKERIAFMYPEPVQTLGDRHVDNLMRVALQGLCVNIETHAAQDPATAFSLVDKDGSGTVDYGEFCVALRAGNVFMGEAERKALWAFLDYEKEGEVEYSEFSRYMRQMVIPENFWVNYVEPYQVERIGRGTPYGVVEDPEDMSETHWCYYVQDDDSWAIVPKGEDDYGEGYFDGDLV